MKTKLFGLITGMLLCGTAQSAWIEWNTSYGNGHYYDLTPSAGTWTDARDAAVNMGGYLAVINDATELNFLRETFGRDELFWIGLNDLDFDGTFTWVNDDSSAYRYYGYDFGNNAGGPSGVVINSVNLAGWTKGYWSDVLALDNQYYGIVERDTLDTGENPTESVPDATGWLELFLVLGAVALIRLRVRTA